MATNDEQQGVDMNNEWTDWRAILRKSKEEAAEESGTVSEVLTSHLLAEIRMIRQTEEEVREQQLTVWQNVIAGVGQILAGLKSPLRRK